MPPVLIQTICVFKMLPLVFACGAQHLKNRRMRVDVAGHQQQQQGKDHQLFKEINFML